MQRRRDGVMTRTRRGRLAVVVGLTLLVAACGRSEAPSTDATLPAPGPPPTPRAELVILHPSTDDADAAALDEVISAFVARHPGIDVRVDSVADVDVALLELRAAGALPDVIVQRGSQAVAGFVRDGLVRPLDDILEVELLAERMVAGLRDLVTVDGRLYAVPLRVQVQSLVWYSPVLFESRGYAIPETWGAMIALSDRMVADGTVPWCIGIEAGPATGWVAADWVEDVVVRALGDDAYERWVAGELRFGSDEVRGAIEQYLVPIWTDDASVLGGRAAIAEESFAESALGVVGAEPSCGMHRQSLLVERIIADLAPDAVFGVDYDFFLLPSIVPGVRPVIGDADVVLRSSDSPTGELFVQFLATTEAGEGWTRRVGSISPFPPVLDGAHTTDAVERRAASVLAGVTSFRLDGSDRMPPEVGASDRPGSFWAEMTAWIAGRKSLDEALDAIDDRFSAIVRAR